MKEINQKWRDLFGSEVEYIFRLGSCFSDPEQKKAFWETVRDKKLADPKWSIYEMFPTTVNAKEKARNECCQSVFARKGFRLKELPKELTEMEKLYGEIIEAGGHQAEVCLWPKRNSA